MLTYIILAVVFFLFYSILHNETICRKYRWHYWKLLIFLFIVRFLLFFFIVLYCVGFVSNRCLEFHCFISFFRLYLVEKWKKKRYSRVVHERAVSFFFFFETPQFPIDIDCISFVILLFILIINKCAYPSNGCLPRCKFFLRKKKIVQYFMTCVRLHHTLYNARNCGITNAVRLSQIALWYSTSAFPKSQQLYRWAVSNLSALVFFLIL